MPIPRFRIRTLMIAVAVAAALLVSGRAISVWEATHRRVSYCRACAAAQMADVRELRRLLADPTLTREEVAELRRAVKVHWILARKYTAIAKDPSLPDLGTAFVTSAEIASWPDPPSSK